MSLKIEDENVGISQGVSQFVCQLKGSKKSRDIPRCVTICVPIEGQKKVGISQEMS